MDQIWAPWRIGYITGADKLATPEVLPRPIRWRAGADPSCFLCRGAAEDSPEAERENLVVCRAELAIALLNRYPYNNGHVLVAPLRHVAKLTELSVSEHSSLMQLVVRLCDVLERLIKPQGFNIGLNLGRAAGAGVPGHLHWHIVPRWQGDTNFMPVLAGVNVIPQSLDALVELLRGELATNKDARSE